MLLLYSRGTAGLAQEPPPQAYLPLVMKRWYRLEDHFDTDADNWTPFLNYWRLNPQQWYWSATGGYEGGGYRRNMCLGVSDCDRGAHDALTMYLEGDSQTWTNYRLRARVNLVSGGADRRLVPRDFRG
ncbi:MAG TPA: hypothetical protein DCP08_02940 [Chloroflexi bacterium]|nr:hypothetical protein [Chloroflexota bacterium]